MSEDPKDTTVPSGESPADDSMSFGDHLEELRFTFIRALVPPFLLFVCVWPFWEPIHDFVAHFILGDNAKLLWRTSLLDSFSVSVGIALRIAALFSIPWIVLNLWWFIRPGLYQHERKFGKFFLPTGISLFFVGLCFAFIIALPATMNFLLGFGADAFDGNQLQRVDDFYALTFAVMTILGLIFMLPMLIAPAVRFGVLKPEWIKKHRKGLIFTSAVLGALLTPGGDPVMMAMVSFPIYFLVEGGVMAGRIWRKRATAYEERQGTISEAFRDGLGESGSDENRELPKGRSIDDGVMGAKAADSFASFVRNTASSISKNLEEGLTSSGTEEAEAHADDDPRQSLPTKSELTQGAPTVRAAESSVARGTSDTVASESGQASLGRSPAEDSDRHHAETSSSAVPMLPRELRRRIDYYIKNRLNELLEEVLHDKQSGTHSGDTPDDQLESQSDEEDRQSADEN